MLGHKLYQCLSGDYDVLCTIRSDRDAVARYNFFEPGSIIENIDASDPNSIRRAIELARPDCVINAIGVIKQVPQSTNVIDALTLNSILPQRLAELSNEFGFRLITISTDCVFDGKKGNYSEDDVPDARDLYGISKLFGEVAEGNALTLRTSIVGRELASHHSILEWFLNDRDPVIKGYRRAIYSGFPTIVLAGLISEVLTAHTSLTGLYHVSSDPISKYELLRLFNTHYGKGAKIEPFDEYVIDRSLDSSKFRNLTGFQPASWDEMVRQMAADPTPYESWR
jgi:dTDP-4-dehydrorhamnose reductase